MTAHCIVIPAYNCADTIEDVVMRLHAFNLPMFIVNDGSRSDTTAAIDRAATHADVTAIHRRKNGGKGAAVMDGLRAALAAGYTHAIQLDADGQHRPDDLPTLRNASRNAPNALILGTPIFPPNTPRSRLWGRQISIFWVTIETLSTAIADPLFGYRVYPLTDCCRVIEANKLGTRMDFDPEIAVRLYWTGLEVVCVEVPVIYRNDGTSHFRMWRDNLRIFWMHTRLALGMIWRFRQLLRRKRHR